MVSGPHGVPGHDDDLPTTIERLRRIQASSLCDADKSLRVVDAGIRAMLPDSTLVGRAFTVVAPDDHLPVLVALREAAPGSVLVVTTGGRARAVSGELFASEAKRRGLAGIVVDGHCRDLRGLRSIGLPVYARGTTPASGTTRDPGTFGTTIRVGGVDVDPGDLVIGDDDGLVIATVEQARAALDTAEEIERAERTLVENMASGRSLHEMTTLDEHLHALAEGRESALGFTV